MSPSELSKKDRRSLFIQRWLTYLFLPIVYGGIVLLMITVGRFRINRLKEVRSAFKKIKQNIKGPLLICPNHLTFLDSLIVMWGLSSIVDYALHFKTFVWNIPKSSHVEKNYLFRVVCYLGKCLLITRGKREVVITMRKAHYLLQCGDYLMVFPEGTRSKTGRVNSENYIYGVGGLITACPNINVLMVYMRGEHQKKMGSIPQKKERFDITMELVDVKSKEQGRLASREIAGQLIQHLIEMENTYFQKKKLE